MKLLTRRQIIEEWIKQPDNHLDNSYCCPKCRDILYEYGDRYFCENEDCSQDFILKSEIDN